MTVERCGFGRFLRWCLCIPVISTFFVAAAYGRQNAPPAAASQSATSSAAKPADYSQEPYVIEKMVTSVAFQVDGTSTTDVMVRVRVQSQAGVQGFGIVSQPYASATSSLQLVYARVTTPDGQVITTPTDNVLDMPAQITQQAPFYSDLKVLQAAVKGLAVGDTLEYAFHAATTKPVDPGQFWFDFDFFKEGVALDEELQISVPQGEYVNVKSPDLKPATETKDGRTIYTWQTSHLESAGASDKDAPPPPKHSAVQITTFHDWGEVGAWFYDLAAPQAVPTADVRAKALELTNGATTDQQKIQALYNFVSTKYRYIGIDFGIGRYQPHPASDVLSNDYGDCKDKDTLFTALLAAVGIKAYPALIGTAEELDPDVPSPAQFDHVITAIPQGKGYLFLDTTPEVAPYGYLIADIRDKKALVIPGDSGATLVQTPADPPFPSFFNFTADGSLGDDGTFTGKMHLSFRGDVEVLVRLAMRQVGESQWEDAVQGLSRGLGFGGTVSDASMSKVDATDQPFTLDYSYERKNYSDWEDNKQIGPPFPPIALEDAPDESAKNPQPIKLGSPRDSDFTAAVKLPANANPQLPEPVSLHESFADYDATYSVSSGTLHAERKLVLKSREVPIAQFDEYRKFVKAVRDDQDRFIPLYSTQNAAAGTSNADAEALFNKGMTARSVGDMSDAAADFQRAVTKDPNYAQAWLMLGFLHMAADRKQGVTEIKKAATLAPASPMAKYVARTLGAMRLPDDSLEVWRMIEKSNPQDADAPVGIGSILMSKKQYADALPELQKAAKLNPTDGNILVSVGQAYINTGDNDQGEATIQEAVKLSHTDVVLNNAAWALVEPKLCIELA
jgi:Flp pilus assembly protein TadD